MMAYDSDDDQAEYFKGQQEEDEMDIPDNVVAYEVTVDDLLEPINRNSALMQPTPPTTPMPITTTPVSPIPTQSNNMSGPNAQNSGTPTAMATTRVSLSSVTKTYSGTSKALANDVQAIYWLAVN